MAGEVTEVMASGKHGFQSLQNAPVLFSNILRDFNIVLFNPMSSICYFSMESDVCATLKNE